MIRSLYLPRWYDVLLQLKKTPEEKRYCQKIYQQVRVSSNHVRNIVKLLEQHRLIEIMPTKKIKRITVTERGKRVAVSILNIKSELGWH